jgi:hypothetical protein
MPILALLLPLLPGLIDSVYKIVAAAKLSASTDPKATAEIKAQLVALEAALEESKAKVAALVVYDV